ncbi:hypothetical protein WR25_15663 isoform A [Diploscapter pachys]|uniref:T20D4.11-like domain-containing protein n=2 Tax=Diploscapter pachys TaxID=2018661 RepID=A0A2A2JCS7_9BILA|nr:hypothetical protein WR25_15663 isoform A [Diploscapter pachys]
MHLGPHAKALLAISFLSLLRKCLTLTPNQQSPQKHVKCTYHDEKKVSECLQPMLDYATKLQTETGGLQFPLQGGQVFRTLCDVYAQFKTCTEDVTCDSLSLDAVDASYGYMCGKGAPLFEHHAACFAMVEVEKNYVNCKIAATQAITEAQNMKGRSTEAYLSEMCRAMDGYLRCSHPVILEKCGAEAWKLVATITRDSLGVTMPDCDMHSALV